MTSEELNIDAEWLKSEIRNNLTELESLVKGPREGCLALTILRRYDMLLKSLKTETPELPPVSPEGLVEGEWYVVKDDDGYRHHVYCVFDPDGEPGLYTLDILYESGFGLNRIAIWGPIDYELEEA